MHSKFSNQAKRRPEKTGVSFFAAIFFGVLFLTDSGHAFAEKPRHVTHVVVIWLKQPQSVQDREALIRATQSFRRMPGVIRIEVGDAMPVKRPGLEQSFDLCAVFTFRDQAALERFQKDPAHMQAIRLVLKPLVKRYIVFNSFAE